MTAWPLPGARAMSRDSGEWRAAGLNPGAVETLLKRVAYDVDSGLLEAAQVALARNGRTVVFESFGSAQDDSLTCIFSITKAIVAAAVWLLIQEGALTEKQAVVSVVPEFADNGKQRVTLEQLLTHTGGFPKAPFNPADWFDHHKRLQRFSRWRLDWEPGTRCEYHPTSSFWVLAEVIERVSGMGYQTFVHERVLKPLGLNNIFLGLPESCGTRALPISFWGTSVPAEDYKNQAFTLMASGEVTEAAVLAFNQQAVRAIGIPGAGALADARDIALLFQAFMCGDAGTYSIWSDQLLIEVLRVRSGNLQDAMFGCLANRSLGLVVAGDEGRVWRGFGAACSSLTFGHNGAGGQIAWADPDSGMSFCYLTPSHERDLARQWQRSTELSDLAARCSA